jgi:hypothetical protein
MQLWLLHVKLSLLAGAFALAGLDPACPVEIMRWLGAVPFPALLAGLPAMAGTVRGLSPLAACRMQWAILRHLARRVRAASAADLKFLHHLPRVCARNFRSKAALES